MRTDLARACRCPRPANDARALHVMSMRQSCSRSPLCRARTPAHPGLPSSQDASHQAGRAQPGGQRVGSDQGHGGSGGGCAQGRRGSKARGQQDNTVSDVWVWSPGTHTAWTAPQGPLGFRVGVHLSVGGAICLCSLRGPGSRPAHSSRIHQGHGVTVGSRMPEPGHRSPSQEQKQGHRGRKHCFRRAGKTAPVPGRGWMGPCRLPSPHGVAVPSHPPRDVWPAASAGSPK